MFTTSLISAMVLYTGYSVDTDTNTVTTSATAGLYSTFEIISNLNLYGFLEFNTKVSIVPFAVNPISTSFHWTHPIALSQGEEMTGLIDAGYSFTIGDVQVYYYINYLFPKVSILDYLTGNSNSLIPDDITAPNFKNPLFGSYPFGYDWV